MAHAFGDVLYLSSDVLSGKSIPLLVGITRLPIDQFLMGLVISMGAAAGSLFSVYAVRATSARHPLILANSLLQAVFSLFFSLSLALSVARGIHYERGIILSLVPVFCTITQSLPLRVSTYLVAFLLVAFLFPFCLSAPAPASEALPDQFQLPSVLQGLNPSGDPGEEAAGVLGVLGRALYLFALAFYACIQHAPTQPSSRHGRAWLVSEQYAGDTRYALFLSMASALGRVCVWYSVCFLQDNTLHLLLENDLSRGAWHPLVCVLYTIILLYSACWMATLIREELLPPLGQQGRLKLVAAVLSLAAFYRQRDPQILFIMACALTGLSVLATAVALDPDKK